MRVVLGSIGRHGDTILTSIVANMLTRKGHHVVWATSRSYLELARATAPDAEVVIHAAFPEAGYSPDITTQGLKDTFPGYDAHVNAQFGAHEDYVHLSGKHPLHWLRDKVARATGIDLGDDWKNHMVFKHEAPVDFERPPGRLAIIAPHLISAPCVIGAGKLREIYTRLSESYDHVRLLVEARPEDEGYPVIYGYSFVEAIKILRMADHFVGQDSGLSWGALYSKCTKEVYVQRARYLKYRFSFKEVDPSVVEHLVEEDRLRESAR